MFPPGHFRQGKRLIFLQPSTVLFIKQEKAWQKKSEAIAPKVGEQAPEFMLVDIRFTTASHLLQNIIFELRRFDDYHFYG